MLLTLPICGVDPYRCDFDQNLVLASHLGRNLPHLELRVLLFIPSASIGHPCDNPSARTHLCDNGGFGCLGDVNWCGARHGYTQAGDEGLGDGTGIYMIQPYRPL